MTINSYEMNQQNRRERLQQRADKSRNESTAQFGKVQRIMSFIPMGQPVLVGHHSERRHRHDLKRVDQAMHKSIEA